MGSRVFSCFLFRFQKLDLEVHFFVCHFAVGIEGDGAFGFFFDYYWETAHRTIEEYFGPYFQFFTAWDLFLGK